MIPKRENKNDIKGGYHPFQCYEDCTLLAREGRKVGFKKKSYTASQFWGWLATPMQHLLISNVLGFPSGLTECPDQAQTFIITDDKYHMGIVFTNNTLRSHSAWQQA